MGEHPHPWQLLHRQDRMSRHRSSKPRRRFILRRVVTQSIRTLGRDNPVIPGVTFQSFPALIKKAREFARPHFRVWKSLCSNSNQAGLCPYTLLRISKPNEPTFGRYRYFFDSVPPQPNCLPTGVPRLEVSDTNSQEWCYIVASATN